ncbi:S8 family serine peptidase [Micromonospora sp. BQ11]|uniref:S8 family serine peptidase n=1 Tax=Micromonospora sp. BQ11 TaxID=3452212 RepID=UPI003F8B82F9
MTENRPGRPMWKAAVAALAVGLLSGPVFVAPAPAAAADTVRGLQWHLDALKIPQAHKITRGRGVTVAVIDGGVHAAHQDLRGQVLPGFGTGPDTVPDGRTDPDRENAHGTGMAGIIAARGGGAMRSLGIAPEARILPISLGERLDNVELATGIRWATDHGATVVSMSLGEAGPESPAVAEAVRYAQSKDVVVVASVGNVSKTGRDVTTPARLSGVVAVAATDKLGARWDESATGPEVVVAAPGARIISPASPAVSPNGYGVGDGTSPAAAVVSGVVALIRSRYPDADAANVVNRLIRTARDEGTSGRDPEFGFGSVDVLAALTARVDPVEANPLASGTRSAAPSARSAADESDDGPAVAFKVKNEAGLIVVSGLCLAAVLVGMVLLVVALRRSRRRRRARGGPVPPTGAHGPYPPVGPPPGYPAPPPPGWPAPMPHQGPPHQGPPHPGPPHPVPGPPGPGAPAAHPYPYQPYPSGQSSPHPPTGPSGPPAGPPA